MARINLNYGRAIELLPNGRARHVYHLLPVGKTNVRPFCGNAPIRSNAIGARFRIDPYYELRPISMAFGGRSNLCTECRKAVALL